ncbi:TIGR01777 family oxidoreductase [Mycolicibacterium sp. HK-90]|uniref:TIGR01777 family oxidoreductase n=1 Tax=Mycolicibacterium sp. HK-90 TaxID=3056937 RepID=UPI00265B6AA9|nr:TIGR01777 family oxidoreductase [Mycolicibacterium sp. HK-90]WKG00861.1 TIGR01777 family oxidoreductase [Mycolicibacterium sp. HK-90]
MGLMYSSIVEAPQEDVFAWHSRPGAFARLSPPWQAMRLKSEAASLRDGRAELALPGGLRWVAEHQADAYDPPRRFADKIGSRGPASLPAALVMRWNHVHDFEAIDDTHTRMVDRVETPAPGHFLRPMFAYRHRQLADDLAAHQRASAHGLAPLTVAVTGASGLVGSALTSFLTTGGHRVIRLVRRAPAKPDERQWNPGDPAPDLFAGVDAVIHLAGASIAGRFTEAHCRAIRDSRIEPTRRLAELAAHNDFGPQMLISASAVGFYGNDRGDELLAETSERGDGFLADVVADWENALAPAEQSGVRVVRIRTGIVQSPRGGTLRLLRPLFSAGLGGRIGDGQQWLAWIGIDDLVDIYHRALWDTQLSGPVNAVSPDPVRNADYTHALGHTLHRPTILPVPSFGPRLLLGDQGARELACASQRAIPAILSAAAHHFRHPRLDQALRHVLGRSVTA